MDPIKIEKALKNKSKKSQLLSTLIVYSLTAFTCAIFCSSPLWFSPLFSSIKSFLFVSLPEMRFSFFTPKCLFVVCNVIIIFLVGESKLQVGSLQSPATDIYDEYMKRSQSLRRVSSHEDNKEGRKLGLELPLVEETAKTVHEEEDEEEEKEEEGGGGEEREVEEGEEEPGLPPDELKQRVEDFIARVNRQMRLEAEQLSY